MLHIKMTYKNGFEHYDSAETMDEATAIIEGCAVNQAADTNSEDWWLFFPIFFTITDEESRETIAAGYVDEEGELTSA